MIRRYESLRSNVMSGHLGPNDADIPRVLVREVELLRDLVWDLMVKARDAPCLSSHPGETTYHCNPERVCRVCRWRDEVDGMLHDGWSLSDGLWSDPDDIVMVNRKEEK
jgi:hypothetical protein